MIKKYEADYAGYVYDKPVTHWSNDRDMKAALMKVDLTSPEDLPAGGLPIISDGKTAYIDSGDSHTAIAAVSGMKKSICGFMPLIYTLARAGESMIITDPKGELFDRTSGFLKSRDYNIKCLDFRTLDKDGFNILEYPTRIYREGDRDKGLMMVSDLVNVFAEKQRTSGNLDVFWPDTAATYLGGTASLMLESFPDTKAINISNWAEFNTMDGVDALKQIMSKINTDNTALLNLRTVLAEPDKTLMSTLSTASSFLAFFIQNNKLARMLSNSTFAISDVCKEKTALFIVTDDTTTTCDTIVGILISQIQSHLVGEAYKSPGGKLGHRVNFVLDEFTSFPIPNMDLALATHRSRNIRYYLCIQSLAGLSRKYPYYEALLANCATTVFMGSTEKELLTRISDQCGRTKITPDGEEKPLISPAELITLKKSWGSKEAIYMNLSCALRYCVEMPSIEAYNLGKHTPPHISFKHPPVKTYTVTEFCRDINEKTIPAPFSGGTSAYDTTGSESENGTA